MPRGGSVTRSIRDRSASAAKGWVARRKLKAARETAAEAERQAFGAFLAGGPPLPAPARGTATDRVLQGGDIKAVIGRAIASLRAAENK